MRRAPTAIVVVLAVGLAGVGGDCGGGSGSGSSATIEIESPDPRCGVLGTPFPPGFDFVPGIDGRAVVANVTPPSLLPFDVEIEPPTVPSQDLVTEIPSDSDSNGFPDIFTLFLDGVFATDPTFAIATASGQESLLFFRPDDGDLLDVRVEVDASFAATDNLFLPAPGTSALQTGIATFGCVRPPLGALDSRGDPIATSVPAAGFCDDAGDPSYYATFTSGVAEAAGHLFVSTSNLGDDQGTENTQYLPGSVLVYDLDRSVDPPVVGPDPGTPVILTTGFNATHVTPWSAGGRDFVLVSVSGAIGVEIDDPSSPGIEGGGIALTDAAIDVIDARTLELVGTIPLGRAGLSFDELAIDPGGRVAVTGSAVDRVLLGITLDALPSLPTSGPPVSLPDAVLFDDDAPFRLPALPGGAPPQSCPGFTVGTAFNEAGDRLYASDFCDGTISVVQFDAPPAGDAVETDDFVFLELLPVVRPLRADTLGQVRAPGSLRVRPGRPGIDYTGPDVLLLVGEPEGLLCGIRVESP